MNTFYQLLINALIVATKNNFVWFALTYWVYLSTRSVISTGIVGGTYLVAAALSGFWLGELVDRFDKKKILLCSNLVTLFLFTAGLLLLISNPDPVFMSLTSPTLWGLVLVLLLGVISGSVFGITIPTLVTTLVPEKDRDKANGLFGTVMGVSFAITSVASGLTLGFAGMNWVLVIAILLTVISTGHLMFISIPNEKGVKKQSASQGNLGMDIKGTVDLIKSIPGLFPLIFFTTFNNLLGGVFMALMDAYGLSLVTVEVWGIIWGFLSFGFIFGGIYIAKKGLGADPLRNLFYINIVIWTVCIFFTAQPSIILLIIGTMIWMCLVPFIEATEQTIVQKVVPADRQGRVFGFAHSVEQAASPLTAFMIGPIAQFVFIPFMTNGRGVELIGDWFGVGEGRGIALVFIISGIIGLMVTIIAMRSKAYKLLSDRYKE
jgi:MFS transporter, DHA3 family, multidrug efflux protein